MKSDYIHTVDVAVLRLSPEGGVEVLLNLRANDPYKDKWALPRLVVNGDIRDDSIDSAVQRLMSSNKVGAKARYIEQIGTVGNDSRDPRCWSSSTYYMAFVGTDIEIGENQRWESLSLITSGKKALPFDHNILCQGVHERLFSKSLYTNLPMMLIAKEFTAPQAISAFESILGRQVQKSSMRQRMSKMISEGAVRETGKKSQSSSKGGPKSDVYELSANEIYFFDRCFEK